MKSSLKKTLLFTLTLLALIFSIVGITPASAAPAKIAPTAEAPSLLQFASSGHILGFTSNGMYAATGSHALHVDFVNANSVQPQSASPASPSTSLRTSADGAAAPLSQVTYANLWDGVTLTYNASGIYTTTYTVAPGADVKNIKLTYNAPLTLNKDGSLSIAFESGTLTESAPIAWQNINGKRVAVEVAYQIRGQEVAFKVGAYNPSHTLLIDPTLTWNTFLGGSGSDQGNSIAVDGSGNVYVGGNSTSTWGAPVQAHILGNDVFVAKLNSSGALQWHTFLGGTGNDFGFSIAVDGSGNVYMAGYSTSLWGTPVRAYTAGQESFVAKLNSSGVLQWNAFLGGIGSDQGNSIAVDGSGNVYVAGYSTDTWGAPVQAYSAGQDAFAAQLNPSGVLQWNTFLGSSGTERGSAIVVDGSGNVYVAGYGGATWGAPVRAYSAGSDVFAAQLNSSGVLQWNTFLGGNMDDIGFSIAVDGSGNVYVAGYSNATWGTPVQAHISSNDTFAAQLNPSGVLQWNTFLGGNGDDLGRSIAVDGSGNVYVAGYSNATWGTPVQAHTVGQEAFAAQLNPSGVRQWSTFLGGSGAEYVRSMAVDGSGNMYVAGYSTAAWGALLCGRIP